MSQLLKETALKIEAIHPAFHDREQTVLVFDNGMEETFLPWFIEAKQPKIGHYYVKDTDGFTRIVESL